MGIRTCNPNTFLSQLCQLFPIKRQFCFKIQPILLAGILDSVNGAASPEDESIDQSEDTFQRMARDGRTTLPSSSRRMRVTCRDGSLRFKCSDGLMGVWLTIIKNLEE